MSEMIKIADDFQYSVNIAYDLHNEKKLKSFIPTKSSLLLLKDILQSTTKTSSDRARVLVGAYGKGKSHIVLAILSLLSGTPIEKFEQLKIKIRENEKLRIALQNYSESKTKLLPVLITGTSNSISQNFLQSLQRTLSENNLSDLMPETNFKAAAKTVLRWKNDYPETFFQFQKLISENADNFILKLETFDTDAYKKFEEAYPHLTSGSAFNPFLESEVAEIYESVVKSIREKTEYSGVYVVYDEFSKYLETNISSATVSDTKMLQDFAEKCNRSAEKQMHLMLICHKEISNYIDTLPKQKVDGWRGIAERFTHIHLNNNFTQTYEIIESVILKDESEYEKFYTIHQNEFENLAELYKSDDTFRDIGNGDLRKIIKGCYPLQPASIFILPRLSERVAQNERTLFTFLSQPSANGLAKWLSKNHGAFKLLTPDLLYDYFEPLFKKEIYTQDLYKTYTLSAILLDKLPPLSLEAKIIKFISLIFMLSQFERISPTNNSIHKAFWNSYSSEEIESALKNLIEKECVVYLKRSNNFYALKQSSGIDINAEIQKTILAQNTNFSLCQTLNSCNFEKALYPLRYNDRKEMTRYFSFSFIQEDEIFGEQNQNEQTKGDGMVFAILPSKKTDLKEIQKKLTAASEKSKRCVFVIPKKFFEIEKICREFSAAKTLLESCTSDNVLRDEYQVILDDLQEVINDFIANYTNCNLQKSIYINEGKIVEVNRKADLTELLSKICDECFSKTPVIVNEALNKNEISAAAFKARNKIILALLRNELENNLSLTGGQELTIMRSILVKTKIIDFENKKINLQVPDKNLTEVLQTIKNFAVKSKNTKKSFSKLYEELACEKNKIGLRKGVIPILLACVFREYKKQIVIFSEKNEMALSWETLAAINDAPQKFEISFMDWSENEEKYMFDLKKLFSDYIDKNDKSENASEQVFSAMRRWYVDLPKYTREANFGETKIPLQYLNLLKFLRQAQNPNDFIFGKLKSNFSSAEELADAKEFFDSSIKIATEKFAKKICNLFEGSGEESLSFVLKKWLENLEAKISEAVFDSRTTRFLKLCKSEKSDLALAKEIAFIASDLNIEDWDGKTETFALKNVANFKKEAEEAKENFSGEQKIQDSANSYKINFVENDGGVKTKVFSKTKISSKGKMLLRSIKSTIDGMGLSMDDAEKRQVVMEVLLDLCGGEK